MVITTVNRILKINFLNFTARDNLQFIHEE